MTQRSEEGSALVDTAVWFVLLAMLVPLLVALAHSPAQAARVSFAVRSAAQDAAKARDAAGASQAASAELDANLLGPGNPPVCADHAASVDASRLRPQLDVAKTFDGPAPGSVEVALRCTLDGRLLTGFPLPIRTTVEVRKRHVADVYRRVG